MDLLQVQLWTAVPGACLAQACQCRLEEDIISSIINQLPHLGQLLYCTVTHLGQQLYAHLQGKGVVAQNMHTPHTCINN